MSRERAQGTKRSDADTEIKTHFEPKTLNFKLAGRRGPSHGSGDSQ
jgi:hypothetical protein